MTKTTIMSIITMFSNDNINSIKCDDGKNNIFISKIIFKNKNKKFTIICSNGPLMFDKLFT